MLEENYGGVDNANALLYAKRWDVYANEKEMIFKGGYLVEVVSHERKEVIWDVLNYHVLEYPTDHDEIGLREFDFNLFNKDKKGVGRERSSEFTYLLMLIKIWPGYQKDKLKRTNQKLDEDNRKALKKRNGRYRKFCRFNSNEFWKNIGCIVSDPTFGLGG